MSTQNHTPVPQLLCRVGFYNLQGEEESRHDEGDEGVGELGLDRGGGVGRSYRSGSGRGRLGGAGARRALACTST